MIYTNTHLINIIIYIYNIYIHTHVCMNGKQNVVGSTNLRWLLACASNVGLEWSTIVFPKPTNIGIVWFLHIMDIVNHINTWHYIYILIVNHGQLIR
jgi:hypothetical protein